MPFRELTCIICPRGCCLKAELDNEGNVLGVTGNSCKRGAEYAKNECTNPMRTVTSTMRCSDGGVVAVKTAQPIPKKHVMDCMKLINEKTVHSPVEIGSVVIENVFGTNIVVTSNH